MAPNASTEKSAPVDSSSTPIDSGLSNRGGATALSVRSPASMVSPTLMARTRSNGTCHHVAIRRAHKALVTRRVLGAISITRSMLPV